MTDDSGDKTGVSPLSTGLRCRCPRCGEGALFKGFLTLRGRCDCCGLDYGKADAGDGPAVFLIFILGFTVVPIVILLEVLYQPPVWVHALVGGGLIIGGALALLRPMKALMIALQYSHKASDSGSERYD